MKKFYINGNTANWANLNVEALDTVNGIIVPVTEIPEDKLLQVTLAGGYDPLCPDVVSDGAAEFSIRHGKKRRFLLLNGGRAVGWASFHRKEREFDVIVRLEQTYTVTAKSAEEAESIVRESVETTHNPDEVIDIFCV